MALVKWNWQLNEWPQFIYDKEALVQLEHQFLQRSGIISGAFMHINEPDKIRFLVELLSDEAQKTSEIEGEYLDRASIQSSIKRNLGLVDDGKKTTAAEAGIAEMMVNVYLSYNSVLSHSQLFEWHAMLTKGRQDLENIGKYRTHLDTMRVVSGRLDLPQVHFEAPPSQIVSQEMDQFIHWFNKILMKEQKMYLPLVHSGITHLYFVSIHPFEDGNGSIARAIAEKSISQSLGYPALLSLSKTIALERNEYYLALKRNNKTLDVTDWLRYFGQTILDAQSNTLNLIEFSIKKAKFFDRYTNEMNPRQLKVVKRLFDAGHGGFKGGLSADNYTRIAKTSASTATRDLNDMLKKSMLLKTGMLKSSRYWLNL